MCASPAECIQHVTRALARAGLTPPEQYLERYPHELSGGQHHRRQHHRSQRRARPPAADRRRARLPCSTSPRGLRCCRRSTACDAAARWASCLSPTTLSTAGQCADRIVVVDLGRIVEQGSARDVLHRPAHPYTRALLSAVPRLDPADRPGRQILRGETSDPMNVAAVAASILAAERAAELPRGRLRAPSTRTRRRASIALPASPSDQDQFIDHVGLVPVRTARVCTLLRMQRERLTVSMEPQTAARVRECGTRTRGGASAYLEHLVRQDALWEAATSAASWYAAHPTYAADSEAETLAALDEMA